MPAPHRLVALPTRAAPLTSDAQLVAAALAGERWASEALFRRHFPTATRFAFRLTTSADAEDVAQDALVEALTHLGKLSNPAAFPAWLRGIVVRTVRQRLRRRRVWQRLGFDDREEVDFDAVIAPHTPPEAALELRELYQAMAELPVEERLVLALSRIEGLTNEEVGASMDISLATVKRRLAAALAKLGLRGGHP